MALQTNYELLHTNEMNGATEQRHQNNTRTSTLAAILNEWILFSWRFFCHYFIMACINHCRANQQEIEESKTVVIGVAEEYAGLSEIEKQNKAIISIKKRLRSRLRSRLRYHFLNHVEKWRDEKNPRFPWKPTLHFLLVGLVTFQVWIRFSSYVFSVLLYF